MSIHRQISLTKLFQAMLEPDYVQQNMLSGLPLSTQLESNDFSQPEKFSRQGGGQKFLHAQPLEPQPSGLNQTIGLNQTNSDLNANSDLITDSDLDTEADEDFLEEPSVETLAECSTQIIPADQAASDLLDPSSLQTVLDMLEVIDSIEELSLLETLTPAQKRQVWEATPELTRLKLKTIRTAASLSATETTGHSAIAPGISSTPAAEDPPADLSEDDPEDLPDDDLAKKDLLPDLLWQPQPVAIASGASLPQKKVAVGDWVVLYANPKLTAAEMMATWRVQEIQGNHAQIHAKALGTRHYPLAWMVRYPKSAVDPA